MTTGRLPARLNLAAKTVLLPILFFSACPAGADNSQRETEQIVVTGNRAIQAELTADLAKSITMVPPKDQPLPRHYQPICLKIFGLEKDYADVLAQRVRDNMRMLNLPVGTAKCQPNSWIGFVSDSYQEVSRLRQEEPEMFAKLHDYEIDRILAGSRAAQAWHSLEAKGVDGKPFNYVTIEINGVQKSVRVNNQYQTGRLMPTTRVDMIGAIVLFDRTLSAGKTVRQLADYATFRLLAPVKEMLSEQGEIQSILSLFADAPMPPAGLTEFDWSYLDAYYKLQRGARPEKVHDAAKRAYLDGAGQKLSENAGQVGKN
jgi:hypothetical protein